jgi:hypothetical protein
LDDLVGNSGAQAALQMHLEGSLKTDPLYANRRKDENRYLARALDKYEQMTEFERQQIPLHPSLTIPDLQARRDTTLPYTPAELSFIIPVLASSLRTMRAGPPSILVSEISCRLKRRVPLLTRLAVRARITGREGKRIYVTAEIWGKSTTRMSALEPDTSGGWEGQWNVLLAEGKGVCVILYGADWAKSGKARNDGAKL